jgi:hypothetical protein
MRIKQLIIGLAASLFAWPALAQAPQLPPGWRMDGSVKASPCLAVGQPNGGADVSIAPIGGAYMLLFSGPEFPHEKAALSIRLNLDGSSSPPIQALASDGVIGVQIGGPMAEAIGAGSRLTLSVNGRDYAFDVKGARAVMDIVARCAKQPTLAEVAQNRPQPIPDAGDWKLVTNLPGAPGMCSARINGREADTVMLLSREGTLVFGPAHPEWASWAGESAVTVSLDGAPADTVKAFSVTNLVLTKVDDKALLARLRKARTLDWTLPNGRFHTDVAGLGVALDRVTACQSKAGG